MNLARIGNKYLADTEPWKLVKTDMARVDTILNIAMQITANLAIAFEPFLPFMSKRLRGMINMDVCDWNRLGDVDIIPAGQSVNKAELLFEKIESGDMTFHTVPELIKPELHIGESCGCRTKKPYKITWDHQLITLDTEIKGKKA